MIQGVQMRLLLKRIVVAACVLIGFFGILYKVAVLPFSTPMFDLISWICIAVAALVVTYIGRKK